MATSDDFARLFNSSSSPKDVVKLADAHGLSVDAVCAHLAAAQDANPDLLGQCLGHHHDFCQQFADRFACHFDFAGLELVAALRTYLWRFRLPGEAAPIGRILEGFARGYFTANPPATASVPSRTNVVAPNVPGGTEPTARGWYVRQPQTSKPCCIACGALARADEPLHTCTGCGVVSFCPRKRAPRVPTLDSTPFCFFLRCLFVTRFLAP